MLLIDEKEECIGNCVDYILADGSLDLLAKILERTIQTNTPSIRIPENISEVSRDLATSLVDAGRSVYVVDKDENCLDTVNSLLTRDYPGVVIDGKLYLNESDGNPQC